eukprot:TRINITY_DN54954_c0_g1_i1.p1 TRINITY_DN54954_c0_g1~~TRINITY_DN54954_c0_g1_i1.p1  ORF type:complete len:106 (-),score=19.92 TRINITY_DN54954_c0_g1_i1:3-320(-)
MTRQPPRATLSSSSAASDVYKRQLDGRMYKELTEVLYTPAFGANHSDDSLFPTTGATSVEGMMSSEYGGISVSYTHLRAHETVLDLVCRLLLEKKKKNKKKKDAK